MSERKRVDELELAPQYQGRETLDSEVIATYVARLKEGEKLPPVKVASVDGRLFVVDGWHTWTAHYRAKLPWIDCEVSEMTPDEATEAAILANQRHGLNRSPADKERAVRLALAHPRLGKLSERDLASALSVSRDLIRRIKPSDPKTTRKVPKKSVPESAPVVGTYQKEEAPPAKPEGNPPAEPVAKEEPPAPDPGAEERAQVSEVLAWAKEFHRRLAGVKEGHPVYARAGQTRREVHVLVKTCEAAMPTTCPACGGDGENDGPACGACGGRGWVTASTAGHMQ